MGKRGPQEKLSGRRRAELLELLALGLPRHEMAALLGVSVATVGNQLRRERQRNPRMMVALDRKAGAAKEARCAPGRRPGPTPPKSLMEREAEEAEGDGLEI